MEKTRKNGCRVNVRRALGLQRPGLEPLEERLPPGNALSWFIGGSLLGGTTNVLLDEPPAASPSAIAVAGGLDEIEWRAGNQPGGAAASELRVPASDLRLDLDSFDPIVSLSDDSALSLTQTFAEIDGGQVASSISVGQTAITFEGDPSTPLEGPLSSELFVGMNFGSLQSSNGDLSPHPTVPPPLREASSNSTSTAAVTRSVPKATATPAAQNVSVLDNRALSGAAGQNSELTTLFTYGNSFVPSETDLAGFQSVINSQLVNVPSVGGPENGGISGDPDGPPDPGQMGPLSVTRREYTLGDEAFQPTDWIPLGARVEVTGSVHHPTDLSGGPRPFILFLHGRHSTCFAGAAAFLEWPCGPGRMSIPSFQGYDYVSNVLASHGYIVVSISANGINARDNSVFDLGMLARAELTQRHLDLWNQFNTTGGAPFGTDFVGKVNLQNIGTMGHSRGGEGVVRHFVYNQSLGSPYGIRAVFPLAPVDFSRPVINNVPLLVQLPYNDGDVSDLQGVHFYDDARYNVPGDMAPKHTTYIIGANHNFYNTIWTPGLFPAGTFDDGVGAPASRLTPAQERGTGLAYMSAFFRTYIGRESQFFPFLTGDAAPPPSATVGPDLIHVSYHPVDQARSRRVVNRTLVAEELTTNTLGGAVTQSGLTPYDLCGGDAPQPLHCTGLGTAQQPHTTPSARSSRRGLSQLRFGWNAPTASWQNDIPPSEGNVSRFATLQFRAGINFTDARNPVGQAQDFSVVLTDASGDRASVRVSDHSRALFYPPSFGGPTPKIFLNTVRIPLSAFEGVNLNNVRSVGFEFNQRPTGALLLTDLMFGDRSLGLNVVSSTPAQGDIVTTQPTVFVIRVSDPYDPDSVQASDLRVNGIPADSVDTSDPTTLRFTYDTSPVTSQGLQTMTIEEGAISRADDGEPIAAFSAQFRYDVLRMQVIATEPAAGSVVELPFTRLRVRLNEAYNPSSVSASDLVLSRGTVTGFTLVDSVTIDFLLSGLTTEGPLTATIPAGAFTDEFGNPSVAFMATYTLDIGTVTFPAGFDARRHSGSLVYTSRSPGGTGTIGTAGDTDTFTLLVDPQQTIAAIVRPTAPGLRPSVELAALVDGQRIVIGSATASAAGQPVVLQPVPTADHLAGRPPGQLTYGFTISGASGTTGSYSLEITLNAAYEGELFGLGANNTIATAQNLDQAFREIGGSIFDNPPDRGAVLGRTDFTSVAGTYSAAAVPFTFEDIGTTGAPILVGVDDAFVQLTPAQLAGFTFTFFGQTYNTLFVSSNGLITFGSGNAEFTNQDLTASPPQAAISPFWDDLVTFDSASSVRWQVLGTGDTRRLVIQWNNVQFFDGGTPTLTFQAVLFADNSMQFNYRNLASGLPSGNNCASCTVGIKDVNPPGPRRLLLAFNNGPNQFVGTMQSTRITVGPPVAQTPDFYSFSLADGETATVGVSPLTGGAVNVQLMDASGTLLADGRATANIGQVISNFRASSTGRYYARVTGGSEVDYNLVVSRNADLDTEANDSIATAQDVLSRSVDGHQWVVGHVTGGGATTGLRVLYFQDVGPAGSDTWLDALRSLGIEPTVMPQASMVDPNPAYANFIARLQEGGWDLVVFQQRFWFVADVVAPFANYVTGGGRAIYSTWNRTQVFPAIAPVFVAFGAASTGGANQTVVSQVAAHPIWDGVPSPLTLALDGTIGVSTIGLQATTGQAIGRWANGDDALIVSNSGRTVLSGFLPYLPTDAAAAARLARNEVNSVLGGIGDDDFYRVSLNEGDVLNLRTQTPAGLAGAFVNGLDPAIRVFDSSGTLVAEDDNSAPDGRNASLRFAVPSGGAGFYFVEVRASSMTATPTSGEYVLSVEGATGQLPFHVTSTDPAAGTRYRNPPAEITVNFSGNIVTSSVQASDLTVDGVPATSVTIVDSGRAIFRVAPGVLGPEGPHTVEISGISSIRGDSLEPLTFQVISDQTPPRVVSSSIQQFDVLPTGNLTYTAGFDEELRRGDLDLSDFVLQGIGQGRTFTASSFSYDSSVLTLNYAGLAADTYILTLRSGVGRVGDVAGWALDGEPPPGVWRIPPDRSGDGAEGGDFFVVFILADSSSAAPASGLNEGGNVGLNASLVNALGHALATPRRLASRVLDSAAVASTRSLSPSVNGVQALGRSDTSAKDMVDHIFAGLGDYRIHQGVLDEFALALIG